MKPDASKICFGLNEKLDQTSLSLILQMAGRKEFADLLSSRMSSEEIESYRKDLTDLLHKHLSEPEYHSEFLQDR
ncbi:MAG: hypothetical protein OCC45_05160 [Desulfotalea sp.]